MFKDGVFTADERKVRRFALPRDDILLPTFGHAIAFIGMLAHPRMVGVNPEVGHEEMADPNYAHGTALEHSFEFGLQIMLDGLEAQLGR